jgi:hypothetical protein
MFAVIRLWGILVDYKPQAADELVTGAGAARGGGALGACGSAGVPAEEIGVRDDAR